MLSQKTHYLLLNVIFFPRYEVLFFSWNLLTFPSDYNLLLFDVLFSVLCYSFFCFSPPFLNIGIAFVFFFLLLPSSSLLHSLLLLGGTVSSWQDPTKICVWWMRKREKIISCTAVKPLTLYWSSLFLIFLLFGNVGATLKDQWANQCSYKEEV